MSRARRLLVALPAVAAALVYLFTHFFRLEDFPIYYLFDEAVQVCHARDYIANGFRGPGGERFPTFFQVAWDASICVSVYLQALGILIFGKGSIWASRFVSALVGCLVPLGVAWAARSPLRVRWWWLGVLVAAALPTWFLHSRTALVIPFMVGFYALMVAAYLAALVTSPRWLYVAALGGALAFYSYASGQVVVPATAGLFVLVNPLYHLRNWRHSLGAGLFSALLLLPALLFRLHNPELLRAQLSLTRSPLLKLPTWRSKVEAVATSYGQLLDPRYWFLEQELNPRHGMAGYALLSRWLLPFFVVGLLWVLWKVREAPYRSLLAALVAAPIAGAITEPEIWRAVPIVVPAAMILTVGFDAAVRALSRAVPEPATAAAAGIALSGYSLHMLDDSLRNGPTWTSDYGLYGTQWGARQLYVEAIPRFLAAHPDAVLSVSPHWANGGDIFPSFFGSPKNVTPGGIREYLGPLYVKTWRPFPPDLVFVDMATDLPLVSRSGRFGPVRILDVVYLPNGLPGFVFYQVDWAPDIRETLAKEEAERRTPVAGTVTIGDQADLPILTSRWDLGELQALFDGDTMSVLRGEEANPFVVETDLAGLRRLRGLRVVCGADPHAVTVRVTGAGADAGREVSLQSDAVLDGDRTIARFEFAPIRAGLLRVEVLQCNIPDGEPTHMHLYEIAPEWATP